jgi:CBS domain-containing protein
VEIMQNQDTGVVPIINSDNELIGLVTDRDICLQVVLNELNTKQTSLSNVMQHDLITCTPEEDLEQIIEKMKSAQVKRILVVEENRCIGIISESDIAQNAGLNAVGSLAQAVYT